MISQKKLMEGSLENRVMYLRVPYNRMNPVVEAEMLKEILDTLPEIKTQRDVAAHLNWPESTVSIHFKLLAGLEPEVRDFIRKSDGCKLANASELYTVSKWGRERQMNWIANLPVQPGETGER